MGGLLLRELSGRFYKRHYWKGGFGWESVWIGGSFCRWEVWSSQWIKNISEVGFTIELF